MSWVKSAKIGDMVDCIMPPPAELKIQYPEIGSRWRIRSVGECPICKMIGIRLEGFTTPVHWSGLEMLLLPQCFRPVVTKPTDISIFKAMLTPAGKVKADA